ncbi:MAG: FKBP-type peptidyl-prolyl cis-trans isomerase [Bacteroidales bacterium]|jgi:FKBP-type peptidyl-prolyl cis-trans isomerase|nr:FKBP-type peptidyl-prolyl cis-trans isomerase [Bacteroidales bacterium]MDD6001381.1 FKBP-type peptidyl-prolyl cis-trans isomerase [Bacteroidales bacterium]
MKKIIYTLAILLTAATASAQKYFDKIKVSSSQDSICYSIGFVLAQNISKENLPINADLIGKAFKDVANNTSAIDKETASTILENFFAEREAKQKEEQLKKGKEFFDKNAKEPGVVTLDNGLQYKIIKQGKENGLMPTDSDAVHIYYEGKLIDGTVFDTSFDSEEPTELTLDYIIPGLAQGLKMMKEGAEYIFYIPQDLAYGEYAPSEEIPAYSPMIFDVELISVEVGANKGNDDEMPFTIGED